MACGAGKSKSPELENYPPLNQLFTDIWREMSLWHAACHLRCKRSRFLKGRGRGTQGKEGKTMRIGLRGHAMKNTWVVKNGLVEIAILLMMLLCLGSARAQVQVEPGVGRISLIH